MIKNKHWEYQASIGQHWSVLGMTKHMSQVPQLQHKDSSGVYYSHRHEDCEGPSDMAPSSNRLARGSQVHLVECNQGVSERDSEVCELRTRSSTQCRIDGGVRAAPFDPAGMK